MIPNFAMPASSDFVWRQRISQPLPRDGLALELPVDDSGVASQTGRHREIMFSIRTQMLKGKLLQ
jgi:hypothetical protein